MIEIRPAHERGHAEHGWLQSAHSFSFGDYHDPAHMAWGPLRVINEDRVQAGKGFEPHGHRDMEIISYVLSGELQHRDNLGNGAVIRPGDVQRMSAGQGVVHSEFNPSPDKPVHFLQIWIMPRLRGVEASYEQVHISAAEKRGQLRLIASPDGSAGGVRLHQEANIYAGLFEIGEQAEHRFATGRLGYVHVARGAITLAGQRLEAGDGARIEGEDRISLKGGPEGGEVLLFDLPR